jgi:hypothetical protein
MNMKKLLLALALFLPLPTQAAFDTGHDLLKLCSVTQVDSSKRTKQQKQADKSAILACEKYLAGLSDLNEAAGMPYQRVGLFFCPTADATIEKMTTIYLRYLQAHPDELDVNAALLAIAALKDAYPCDYKHYLDRK